MNGNAVALTPGTAVPKWVSENLPKYLIDRPATAEMLYSSIRTLLHSMASVYVGAFAIYSAVTNDGSIMHFSWLCVTHPWSFAMPIFWAYVSGKTAFGKASAAANGAAPKPP